MEQESQSPDSQPGLSSGEVAERRRVHGYNEIAEPRPHPVLRFLGKFWGLSAWTLELILVLSAYLGKYADFAVVALLLLVNAVLAFAQESRASNAVAALRRRLQVSARVHRDQRWQLAPARELVPGDVVRMRAGDIAPADVRLLGGELAIDQSALTGESGDVRRAGGELVPSGAIICHGEADGVVTQTGARTLYGRTTELVQEARPRLHVEEVVAGLVRRLFLIVGTLLAVVASFSLLRGAPVIEMAPLMLVLLMSAIPVALPVMFTVTTAVGARELARRGVLVTRLSAAEDAATMDVLCVDKTGTLTLNRLAVAGIVPVARVSEADVVRAGAFASQEANADPIDLAFIEAARARGVADDAAVRRLSFAPFDPGTRRTEALVEDGGQRLRVVKGAVRTVAALAGLAPAEIDALEARSTAEARNGYRTLAVARGAEGDPLALLGLVLLLDPPRPEARPLVDTLRRLGVSVLMLTGDALPVAREIARQVGLSEIRSAKELAAQDADGPADAGSGALLAVHGYAEVFPEDKYLVVSRLQAARHVVGMTGDGVNDAPALRQAEVGIAVSTATDAAKGAASVVLTEPGLANIVALVEQGRVIYQRILTWIINKISRTILKAGFVAVAYLVTGKFVVSAFAMLLLVFTTDFAKIALAADEVIPSARPETWNIGGFVAVSALLGLAMVLESLLLVWAAWVPFGLASDGGALHTFSFLLLLYFGVFSIVSARERRGFWRSRPSAVLMLALLGEALGGTALTYAGLPSLTPLPAWQVALVLGCAAFACLVVNDGVKVALLSRWVPATPSAVPVGRS